MPDRHRVAIVVALASLAVACEKERTQEIAPTPVRMEMAKRMQFAPELTLVGVVRSAQTVPLAATRRGTLVYARRFAGGLRTGESVSAGELIAEVRNDQVVFAARRARLEMDAAAADADRIRRSFEQGVASGAENSAYEVRARLARETYEAAQRDISELRIVAPVSGRLIVARGVAPGVIVEAGTVLAEIASTGAPIVESAVAAADRDLLHAGLPVQFSGPGGWKGSGRIRDVASVIDPAGTARVVAGVAAGASVPAPGTGVDLVVQLDQRPDVLTVPEDAIVAGSDGPAVFVATVSEGFEKGYRVKRAPVVLGGRGAGRVEIRTGLRDGDRVVVSGADTLTDDALVSETTS